MKVLVQYLVEMSDGKVQDGREAWIGRIGSGALVFSTIYTTEQTAPNDITQEELDYLNDLALQTKKFKVVKTIA
ncbi:TPA: hypothetical protein ACJEU7_002411 [Acinetobacter baumannii]